MNIEKLKEMFEVAEQVDLKFEDITHRVTNRPDLHAMLLLDSLFPSEVGNMVSSAEHDQIWLDVDLEEVQKVITQEQVNELEACGVWIWEDEGFSMFV